MEKQKCKRCNILEQIIYEISLSGAKLYLKGYDEGYEIGKKHTSNGTRNPKARTKG